MIAQNPSARVPHLPDDVIARLNSEDRQVRLNGIRKLWRMGETRFREKFEEAATDRVSIDRGTDALTAILKLARRLDAAAPQEPEYFVSYAWGDNTERGRQYEEVVERFCATARQRHIRILRDSNTLRTGQSISNFMRRLGRSDRIFIVLSDKYLKSPYCMFELHEVWRNCKQDDQEFLNRIRIYALPDAKIWTVDERAQLAVYWQHEIDKLNGRLRTHGADIMSESDFRRLRLMRLYSQEIGEILAALTDILQPKTFEDFENYGENYGFADL